MTAGLNPAANDKFYHYANIIPKCKVYFKPGNPNCLSASNNIILAELARLKDLVLVLTLMGMRIAVS